MPLDAVKIQTVEEASANQLNFSPKGTRHCSQGIRNRTFRMRWQGWRHRVLA